MGISEKRQDALRAFKSEDYKLALALALEIAPYGDPGACYICAVIYEYQHDLKKAYFYFDLCRKEGGTADAYNGCVRIILKQGRKEDILLAKEYCEAAIAKSHDGISYLLLGRLLEELSEPPDFRQAKRMYLRAALHGAAWGMRRFANLEYKLGIKPVGVFYHVAATLLFPIFRLLFGNRTLRVG
jgi:TPR repeat protein